MQLAANCCSHPRMLNANSTHTAGQAQMPFGRTVVRSVGPSSGVFNCDHCVAHFSLSLSLSHCPSVPLCPTVPPALPCRDSPFRSARRTPHSALRERNELNALPATPPHFSTLLFSVSFCPTVCRCVCPLPLPMPSTTSSTFFSLHFWCFIQNLDGAFECLNSTRLESRAEQSEPRDELPLQLSIQSISIQSKLSESICLPSGISHSPRSLGIFVVKVSGSFMPSSSKLESGSAFDSSLSSLDTGKQTNYLSSDSVFASPLSAPCKYFHSHSHSHSHS